MAVYIFLLIGTILIGIPLCSQKCGRSGRIIYCCAAAEAYDDYKTILQEIIQRNPEERVEYRLVSESGPDHNKSFTVRVMLNSNIIGEGTAHSKKSAEQLAAREALRLMGWKKQ